LNLLGSRTATGAPWTPKAIRELVKNAVYRGALQRYPRERDPHYYAAADPHDGRREVGRPFPAVVDDRLWEAVQRERGTPWRTKYHYPLSGVTRCGKCLFRMQGAFSGRHRYYRCHGRMVGVCDAPHLRADAAEETFADWLDSIRLPAGWREALAKMEVRAVVAEERDRTRAIEAHLARIKNLYAWGELDEAEYRKTATRLRGEAAVMVKPDIANVERVAEALAAVGQSWRKVPLERRRELPGRLLRQITVEDGRITEFVARPELRPLLELGVVTATSASTRRSHYTVRYSA
jgi:hypothetical protein